MFFSSFFLLAGLYLNLFVFPTAGLPMEHPFGHDIDHEPDANSAPSSIHAMHSTFRYFSIPYTCTLIHINAATPQSCPVNF